MAPQQTIWDRFLSPVVRLFINEPELRRYAESVDWEKESEFYRQAEVNIPTYYSSQNFHGIKGGYLNYRAAVSYDPITQYVVLPNETWVRQALVDNIKGQPRRILDLGCGTGSTTLMLKQAFQEAQVIGLDLSPYMLVRAKHKATEANLNITWQQGNAENTVFESNSFDLVTASLLFHETPADVAQAILEESFRLLQPGGQVLILDGNQNTIRQLEWLNNVFEEPYIREYAAGSLDASMSKVGFELVNTQDFYLIHQVTSGFKPIPVAEATRIQNIQKYAPNLVDNDLQDLGSPVGVTA